MNWLLFWSSLFHWMSRFQLSLTDIIFQLNFFSIFCVYWQVFMYRTLCTIKIKKIFLVYFNYWVISNSILQMKCFNWVKSILFCVYLEMSIGSCLLTGVHWPMFISWLLKNPSNKPYRSLIRWHSPENLKQSKLRKFNKGWCFKLNN